MDGIASEVVVRSGLGTPRTGESSEGKSEMERETTHVHTPFLLELDPCVYVHTHEDVRRTQ